MSAPRLTNGGALGSPAQGQVGQFGDGSVAGENLLQGDDHGVGGVGAAARVELPRAIVGVVGDAEDGLARAKDLLGREHGHVARIGKGPVGGREISHKVGAAPTGRWRNNALERGEHRPPLQGLRLTAAGGQRPGAQKSLFGEIEHSPPGGGLLVDKGVLVFGHLSGGLSALRVS